MKFSSLGLGFFLAGAAAPYAAAQTDSCALISVVMDESGSMSGEQAFIRDDAIPKIVSDLKDPTIGNIDNVFVCAFGYGSGSHGTSQGGHLSPHDCTSQNTQAAFNAIFNYVLDGGTEDGWQAIDFAIANEPTVVGTINLTSTCASLAKNMILVTDEDRDVLDSSLTQNNVTNDLLTNGWTLNAILNIAIQNAGLGVSPGASAGSSTVYTADGSGNYTVTTLNSTSPLDAITGGGGTTEADYPPIAFATGGASWDLNQLRAGGNVDLSFAKAFSDIKVEEILATDQPTSYPSGQPSETPTEGCSSKSSSSKGGSSKAPKAGKGGSSKAPKGNGGTSSKAPKGCSSKSSSSKGGSSKAPKGNGGTKTLKEDVFYHVENEG